MKAERNVAIFVALAVALLSSTVAEAQDGVSLVVVAPKTMYSETPASITITAVSATEKTGLQVGVAIRVKNSEGVSLDLYKGTTDAEGRCAAGFDVPDVAPGRYALEVTADGAAGAVTGEVDIRAMPVVLIETDKPIYKPGQVIKGRVLVLNRSLRPKKRATSVEISDGKGIKVFRKELETNAFGVAPFELNLADEVNFGTWKITAVSGNSSGQADVRVEEYVLPRFEVKVGMEKDYFLVDEEVTGTVDARYFFGKPVDGTVHISATKYTGVWEEYASYTGGLSEGGCEFVLPAAGYVAGTSGAGGAGSVQLEIVVTDTSGHEEKTTKLLRIVGSSLNHQLIATSRVVAPGRPYEVMLVAKTQEGDPVGASADVECTYYGANWQVVGTEKLSVGPFTGSTTIAPKAPEGIASVSIRSTAKGSNGASAEAELTIYAAYSPTDSFLYLSREGDEAVNIGDMVTIDVFKTHEATIYYDVFANGHTIWSDAVVSGRITFRATQQMVPKAKVVAYVINPNNEISADSLEFEVRIGEAAGLGVSFGSQMVLPGEQVQVSIDAETEAMVGVAIVDESVYALNEGRLNMQAVFDELERLFMEPQSETHQNEWNSGAYGVFEDAGLQVLTSAGIEVPQGQKIWKREWWWRWLEDGVFATAGGANGGGDGLAEVTRVRQFFPETWLWTPDFMTGPDGKGTINLTAPDSITTWRLHAVSTSAQGLGVGESKLVVFQEFFGEPDLPYAVTRGEEFPVRIQVFNYLDEAQKVRVELAGSDWFEMLEEGVREVEVGANSVGLASFVIKPKKLGRNMLDVTLRSPLRADAVRKEMLVEAEGTRREMVDNGMIKAGEKVTLDGDMPEYRVAGSEKVLLSVTPSLVAQSINGVEDLLQMPYGCGEQNMIFFAPDVEILRYLNATGQLTPEIRAKAESFINAGYQRELTYRRADGSFSAFGDSDDSGSLWLTAFVLDVFSGARDVHAIDDGVLAGAAAWIQGRQLADGSWEPVGFLHHQDMMGGLSGNYTLTAFVTIALADYGSANPAVLSKAMQYLGANATTVWDEPYALAVAGLAMVRAGNPAAEAVISRLLEMAIRDGDGMHWEPYAIETTAYAALAMIDKEMAQANEAIKWISLQQNAQGGFGNTQDTVMALKALMTAARAQSRNVDLVLTVNAAETADGADGAELARFEVNGSNFDVLQVAEIPAGIDIRISAEGSGEVRYQLLRRFNVLLRDERVGKDMSLDVVYDANDVEVDDIVKVHVTVRYFGAAEQTGMMIVDVGVPTGFAVVQDSLDALLDAKVVSRADIAGRKVIFYVDGLAGGEERTFMFEVKARYPVRAIIPDSKAYLYYEPEVRAEDEGVDITVKAKAGQAGVYFAALKDIADNWLHIGDIDIKGDENQDRVVDLYDLAVLGLRWMK